MNPGETIRVGATTEDDEKKDQREGFLLEVLFFCFNFY